MKLKVVCAAALIIIASSATADEANSAIDRLINSAGLGALDGQEREAARSLVRRLLLNRSSSDTLAVSAKEHMQNEGYEPVHLSTVYADGDYYLVARTNFSAYATKDLPLGVGSALFKDGEYFAKKNAISGGVSEFIDENGDEQQLMFAEWILLR